MVVFHQYGGVRGPLHSTGHHGQWDLQVSGYHPASQIQVRGFYCILASLHRVQVEIKYHYSQPYIKPYMKKDTFRLKNTNKLYKNFINIICLNFWSTVKFLPQITAFTIYNVVRYVNVGIKYNRCCA